MSPEDRIDPRKFLAWQRDREAFDRVAVAPVNSAVAELIGVDGRRPFYDVRPIIGDGGIDWIDAAGFAVARSPLSADLVTQRPSRHDFRVDNAFGTRVTRTF